MRQKYEPVLPVRSVHHWIILFARTEVSGDLVAETEPPQTRRAAGLRLSGRLFLHSRLPDQRDVLARPTSETEDGLSLGTFGLASGDRIALGSKMVASQPRVLHIAYAPDYGSPLED